MATAPQAPAQLDMNAVVNAFINIRDARSALKREFEAKDDELKGKQARLEAVMLGHLNATNMAAVRVDGGTVYKQEEVKPSCSDWSSFYQWVSENDAFDALEKRLTKKFMVEFMEAHEGALPPGVSVHREFVVRVRRGS